MEHPELSMMMIEDLKDGLTKMKMVIVIDLLDLDLIKLRFHFCSDEIGIPVWITDLLDKIRNEGECFLWTELGLH